MLPRYKGLLAAVGTTSALIASVLWLKILADAWPTLFLAGTLCGQPEHCPLCTPAWTFSALAAIALGAWVHPRARLPKALALSR